MGCEKKTLTDLRNCCPIHNCHIFLECQVFLLVRYCFPSPHMCPSTDVWPIWIHYSRTDCYWCVCLLSLFSITGPSRHPFDLLGNLFVKGRGQLWPEEQFRFTCMLSTEGISYHMQAVYLLYSLQTQVSYIHLRWFPEGWLFLSGLLMSGKEKTMLSL